MRLLARIFVGVALLVALAIVGAFAYLQVRLGRGIEQTERLWRESAPERLADLGSTRSLSILPLVDWHTSRADLKSEAGVSYLIRTDANAILFDVGFNRQSTDPSPLQHNMDALGIGVADFDTVVISHNHPDHVGGMRWARRASFSLGPEQIDLSGKRAFTPVPMSYPGIVPVHAPEPTVLGAGVATTGTIPRQLFIGRVEEQALAVNVRDKGIVLIVGCGHQTLPRILERASALFSEPIYGLVGGLHYPVPEGRGRLLGLDVQRLLAWGEGPFDPLTESQVQEEIALLKQHSPGLVGLSGHDSSDPVIEWFREAFGPAQRDVRVGEWIEISG
jgi:metal-dependent hydrolase (beta-lactamase superfamily II)